MAIVVLMASSLRIPKLTGSSFWAFNAIAFSIPRCTLCACSSEGALCLRDVT